uniref:NADH dehydrogenase subunit 4L n=1 Tax=Bemisia tabaci TaxID=7038 RepID=A0A345U668_BEMTA|nr:NADH dehydrogenase subunit 4L [Bemisia tabaci]ATJ03288.1 NADH dehydrogenase subunit 4L [Bemisia tabaci]AXE73231.1 NADH dehydrogenase subunit 4L [Bemisia tabaci]AXE73244.1 NADH dehydrogenase subunit 4L [Bemisia tabaci]AXI95941.1 NADH dehydrogenase subunit 4L [Bemisia tabaci]
MKMEEMVLPILLMVMIYLVSKMNMISSLIMIEYISIMVIITMMILIKTVNMENHNVLYFIILMITESVLGLSILISMIRTHGNDFMKSSSVLKL